MADENTQQTESERNLTKLLAKKDGDAMALAADLLTENAQLRGDKRTLNGRVAELEDKVPKDGTRVLSKADGERFDALMAVEVDGAKGDAQKIKASLEQATRDRQAVVTQANREALSTLGLKPSALRLREFDGVTVTAKKDGDAVTATVKDGDAETPWDTWVKGKGLEADLKDFGLTETVTVVPAIGQVGRGTPPGNADPVDALNKQMFGGKQA